MIQIRGTNYYTYDEVREMAIKEGIADNRIIIGIWLKMNGYLKRII